MAFNTMYTGYSTATAITPSDTVSNRFKAIYVGGAGNLAITAISGGAAVTLTAPPVGSIIPIETSLVMSTNTTATLLIGLN